MALTQNNGIRSIGLSFLRDQKRREEEKRKREKKRKRKRRRREEKRKERAKRYGTMTISMKSNIEYELLGFLV